MNLRDLFKKNRNTEPAEETASAEKPTVSASYTPSKTDIPEYDEVGMMRTKLVQSQMGPHFIFNVLNTIYYLCEKDPLVAQKAVLDLSSYLRKNMDFIRIEGPVPFMEEMSLVNGYLELEKLRYGDELTVRYHLDACDFSLPAFSVQAIVENAVRHGAGKNEDGGTIEISAYEGQDDFCVDVSDDGSGFDENVSKNDSRSHTGIENVRYLLKYMCGGTLTYVTGRGYGTHALIRIPK